jgi:hypothetical protein
MITKEKVEEGKAVFFSQEWAGTAYTQGSAELLFSWLSKDTIQIVKEVLGDRCFTVPVSDWTEMDQRAMNVICWLTAFE